MFCQESVAAQAAKRQASRKPPKTGFLVTGLAGKVWDFHYFLAFNCNIYKVSDIYIGP